MLNVKNMRLISSVISDQLIFGVVSNQLNAKQQEPIVNSFVLNNLKDIFSSVVSNT